MRSTTLSLGTGLALLGALACPLGCTEAVPPPTVPTAPVAPVGVAATGPAAPVDLAPVPQPNDSFVVARRKSPNTTLSGMGSCAGVPQQTIDSDLKLLL